MKNLFKVLLCPIAIFLFLVAAGNLKPTAATHSYGCSVITTSTTAGGSVTVNHGGLVAGETFRMYGTNVFFAADLGQNSDSTGSLVTQTFNVPSGAPVGNYRIELDFRFHSPDKEDCDSTTFSVGAAATTSCTYNFSPTNVLPGGALTVNITTGNSSHKFDINISEKGTSRIVVTYRNLSMPLFIPLAAPTASGDYTFTMFDVTTSPAVLCGGNTELTVSTAPGITFVVAINNVGCSGSLSCLVSTTGNPSLPQTVNSYTYFGLPPNTTYDLYVCTPDCGTGTYVSGWGPKACTSDASGALYASWSGSDPKCGSPGLASSDDPGGAGCFGFLTCLAGVRSPTDAYTETGLVGAVITSILPIAIGLGAFLTVIIIVISGVQFITSNGNPEGAAAARARLTFAIIGLALLILAFAITQIVDNIFLRGSGAI